MTDKEQQRLREQIEYGHKARVVQDFLSDFLLLERANVINQLETGTFSLPEELGPLIIYLRTLKRFELAVKTYMDTGEIAEKELNEHGEQ